jgi:hypothetical protein
MNFPAIVERLTRLDFPGPTYIALTYDIVLKDSPEDLRRQREGWTAIFYP